MANQFIGLHMRVVLKNPPGYELTGVVRDVEAGSGLTLTDVFIVASKQHTPHMRINANNIADLSEVSRPQPAANYAPPPSQAAPVPVFPQAPTQNAFVDPAILSVGRRPASGAPAAPEVKVHEEGKGKQPSRDITDSIKDLSVGVEASLQSNDRDKQDDASETASKKKRVRTRRGKQHKDQPVDNEGQAVEDSAADGTPGAHGAGWRQTPILQSTSSFQPFNSLKRNGKGRKSFLDNGWASEDVTEEMGDFDFENNLAKFDKRTIFDQMRKDDIVEEESRLVSHNRRIKPGTAGGKNLHYTENVLEMPSTADQNNDFWNSEAEVGGHDPDRLSSREAKNGHAMRRTESKSAATRRSQSRKASAAVGSQPLSRVNSSVRLQPSSRRSTPRSGHRSADQTLQQTHRPSMQPGLYLMPSLRRLEAISTLQMLNLENIAANELGFSEGLMAENAGRGIAEIAVTALSDPAIKARYELSSTEASIHSSTIVVLAGNNKSSIRALVAGRHLRNKNFDVVVCLVGIERERDLLEDLRRQIQLYRNFGGKVFSKNDFFEHLRKGSSTGSPLSISLIVDALLGLTISFEELRVGDQATVYELMEWANRNEAFVLSVDVPTGIDPSSGKIAIIDGGQLFIKPRYVVAIGAPKKGLLEAVTPPQDGTPEAFGNAAHDEEWRLYIADLGLGSAVWRKAGTKIRRGIDFDGKWVLEMRYCGLEAGSDDDG